VQQVELWAMGWLLASQSSELQHWKYGGVDMSRHNWSYHWLKPWLKAMAVAKEFERE
jgi:hypothetical protein